MSRVDVAALVREVEAKGGSITAEAFGTGCTVVLICEMPPLASPTDRDKYEAILRQMARAIEERESQVPAICVVPHGAKITALDVTNEPEAKPAS